MLENSRKDIGRCLGLNQKRSGTELTYTNQMENGTMSLILRRLISVKGDIPFFVDPVLFVWWDLNSKGKGKSSITFQWQRRNRRSDSSYSNFRQSAQCLRTQCLRSSSGYVWSVDLGNSQTGKPVAPDNVETMVMPPEVSTTSQNFSDQCKSTRTTVAWIRAEVRNSSSWKRSVLHDTWWHRTWQTERFMSRVHLASKWSIISSDAKIGQVLDVMVCYHQGRYGVEIMNESLFGDKTCSWVRIVNWINKYVTEMSEETHVESIVEKSTGQPVAKARPPQTSNSTLSPVSIPYLERKWTDVEPRTFDQNCLEVSKLMIRLLRHDDSINREEDGAVKNEDLTSIFRACSAKLLAKRRWSQEEIPAMRGPQLTWNFSIPLSNWRHSGGTHIDPTLQDNALLPDDFVEHIYHVGSCHDLHSIIQSGLISGGKSVKKERHVVFFTVVNPMFVDQYKEVEYDLTNPRIAVNKKHWKIHQHTENGCDLKFAQKKGLQFYQTRSNAIILYNKVYQSPRSPQRAVLKPKLYHGRQDSSNFEAWTSVDNQSEESEEYGETRDDSNSLRGTDEFGETCSGNIDFRIQGPPHSIVQKQDDIRRETVKKLIHQHTQIASRWWQT